MENIKVKGDKSGLVVCGWIFIGLGTGLLVLGLFIGMNLDRMFMLCMGGGGLMFLSVGVLFLVLCAMKTARQQKAVDEGLFVWGQVQSFTCDRSVTVNGRHPVYALVQVSGGDGMTHIYRSNSSWDVQPLDSFIGTQVRVYGPELRTPYVDLSPLEEGTVRHF